MSDFIKKVFYIIIGMLIAVFIIGGALWFINEQFLTRSPFKEQEVPITAKHSQGSLTQDYYLTPQNEQSRPNEITSLSHNTDTFFDTAEETISQAAADSSSTSVNTSPSTDQSKKHTNHLQQAQVINQRAKEEEKDVVALPKPTNPGSGTEPAIDHKTDAAKANINKPEDNSLAKEQKEGDHLGQLIQNIQNKVSNTEKIKVDHPTTEKKAEANYLIQMGSYQSEAEAERQKAHLLILNVPARVNKVKVNDKDFFRVVSAKKFSKKQAEQIKSTLQSQHINSILIPENPS
jgi:sporulation related domain